MQYAYNVCFMIVKLCSYDLSIFADTCTIWSHRRGSKRKLWKIKKRGDPTIISYN